MISIDYVWMVVEVILVGFVNVVWGCDLDVYFIGNIVWFLEKGGMDVEFDVF